MLTFYLIALFFFTKYALVSAASPGNDCAEGYFDVMLDHFGCSNASFYYCNARGDYDVKDLKASCFGRNATLEDKWYRSFCEDDAWRENALGCNPKQFVEFDFDVNAVSCRGRRSSQLVAVLEEEELAAYENELNCDGVYQCADRSDEADCASSQVPTKEIELGAFECKRFMTLDGRFVCNGKDDCPDGDDEGDELCGVCPRPFGHPPRNNLWSATFLCKHNVTGKPLCAIPCDGSDNDPCAGGIDEQACTRLSFVIMVAYVGAGVAAFFALLSIARVLERRRCDLTPAQSSSASSSEAKLELISFESLLEETEPEMLTNILLLQKATSDVHESVAFCRGLYEAALSSEGGNVERADAMFYARLGTNDVADYFYSHAAGGLKVRAKQKLSEMQPRAMSGAERLERWLNLRKAAIAAKYVVKVVAHYLDLAKDLAILLILLGYVSDSSGDLLKTDHHAFPTLVVLVMMVSIGLAELSNGLVIASHPAFAEESKLRKLLRLAMTPLVPAVAAFEEMRAKFGEADCVVAAARRREATGEVLLDSRALSKCRLRSRRLFSLRAEFRAGENSLEHFVQFSLYILIVLLARTSTGTAVSLDKVFLERGAVDTFLFISALISFLSVVRGQVYYVASRKEGYLPLTGVAILIPYFFLGASSRVLAVVALFTPSLGLFNTLYHFHLGRVDFDSFAGGRVFDVHRNGTVVETADAWKNLQYETASDFVSLPYNVCAIIWLAFVAFHVIAGFFLLRPYMRSEAGYSRIRLLLQSIFTLLCPPLFHDWDEITKREKGTNVDRSWRASQALILKFVALSTVENLSLCIPLALLKVAAGGRNSALEDAGFPPISPELGSTAAIDRLLLSAVATFLIVPLAQILLERAYFRHGHAWSRLLNAHVGRKKRAVPNVLPLPRS